MSVDKCRHDLVAAAVPHAGSAVQQCQVVRGKASDFNREREMEDGERRRERERERRVGLFRYTCPPASPWKGRNEGRERERKTKTEKAEKTEKTVTGGERERERDSERARERERRDQASKGRRKIRLKDVKGPPRGISESLCLQSAVEVYVR